MLVAWVHERPLAWSVDRAREDLELGLEDWHAAHGWRAVVGHFEQTLQALLDEVEHADLSCRSALSEGLGLWLCEGESAGPETWSGAPLDPGARLINPEDVAMQALGLDDPARGLSHGETIVVLGDSAVLRAALIAAHKAGLEPRPRLGEGGPHREGLSLAQSLVEAGLQLTLCYDIALAAEVHAADRVWVASEAVGHHDFIAPAGCGLLLDRAREAEVLCELLASSNARTPSGTTALPAWNDTSEWLLWEDAPSAVHLEAGAFERVSLALCRDVVCETGRLSPHNFASAKDTLTAAAPTHESTDQAASVPELRATDRLRMNQR